MFSTIGHYLYLQADPDQEARFPHANLISPVFGAGSYQCSLSFWFYMYHDKVQDYNDAILNVLYKRDSRYTSLLHIDDTSGKTWKNQIVQLPRCPRQFNVRNNLNTKYLIYFPNPFLRLSPLTGSFSYEFLLPST